MPGPAVAATPATPTEAPLSRAQIEAGLERLAPFHHNIELPHGLRTHLPAHSRRRLDEIRVAELVAQAWPALLEACGGSLAGLRVIDPACNCGGFSFQAAASGAAQVVGIDVTDRYLEQARFLRQALHCTGVEFRKLPIEEVSEAAIGRFDVALFLGLLYHLENPVLALRRLASVTDRVMLLETKLEPRWPEESVWTMEFVGETGPESRIATTSLWRRGTVCQFAPTARAVVELLQFAGFATVRQLPPLPGMWRPFLDGRRGTFLAIR